MKVAFTYDEIFEIEGTVNLTWEGDPDVPGGTRPVADIEFIVKTTMGEDVTEYIKQDTLDLIEEKLIERAKDEDEPRE